MYIVRYKPDSILVKRKMQNKMWFKVMLHIYTEIQEKSLRLI